MAASEGVSTDRRHSCVPRAMRVAGLAMTSCGRRTVQDAIAQTDWDVWLNRLW